MSDNKINTGAIFKNKNKTAIDDQQAPEIAAGRRGAMLLRATGGGPFRRRDGVAVTRLPMSNADGPRRALPPRHRRAVRQSRQHVLTSANFL